MIRGIQTTRGWKPSFSTSTTTKGFWKTASSKPGMMLLQYNGSPSTTEYLCMLLMNTLSNCWSKNTGYVNFHSPINIFDQKFNTLTFIQAPVTYREHWFSCSSEMFVLLRGIAVPNFATTGMTQSFLPRRRRGQWETLEAKTCSTLTCRFFSFASLSSICPPFLLRIFISSLLQFLQNVLPWSSTRPSTSD